MKTKNLVISFFLMLFLVTSINPKKVSAQNVSVSFQIFYDELSPYGTWVNNTEYGYVWYPNVSSGFMPYATNGYWVFTEVGWTWVSDYPWGWAPFHYGRWYNDYTYGPMWIPDNEWGPGWVTWRRSAGYYGWAAIGPGINMNVAYSNAYNLPSSQWIFVNESDFGRTNIYNYYVNVSNNTTIINNSTVISNAGESNVGSVTYNRGPNKMEVEKSVGKTVTEIALKEKSQPGQNLTGKQLQIYRPKMNNYNVNESKSVPTNVGNLNDVKTLDQRTGKENSQKSNQLNNQNPTQLQNNEKIKNEERNKQQQVNPYKNENGIKQQQTNPNGNDNGIKQQQSNPNRRDNEIKQQQNNQNKREEGIKNQQQQQVNPIRKEEGVKQQQVNPSKREEEIKQKQGNPKKKTDEEKLPQ